MSGHPRPQQSPTPIHMQPKAALLAMLITFVTCAVSVGIMLTASNGPTLAVERIADWSFCSLLTTIIWYKIVKCHELQQEADEEAEFRNSRHKLSASGSERLDVKMFETIQSFASRTDQQLKLAESRQEKAVEALASQVDKLEREVTDVQRLYVLNSSGKVQNRQKTPPLSIVKQRKGDKDVD